MDDDRLRDLFASLGPVQVRRMFGGQGVYCEGMIVAVIIDGEVMLKADGETAALFEHAGSRRWSYQRGDGAPVFMPYFCVPDEALDDPAIMDGWAALALAAARRAPVNRRRSKLGRSP